MAAHEDGTGRASGEEKQRADSHCSGAPCSDSSLSSVGPLVISSILQMGKLRAREGKSCAQEHTAVTWHEQEISLLKPLTFLWVVCYCSIN